MKIIAAVVAAAWLAGVLMGSPAVAAEQKGYVDIPAAPSDPLYRSVAIVTGRRVETRVPGFAQTFADVLIKLTGDPSIVDDKRFAELARHASDYVVGFSYRDRREGKPLIDEQGTYDRPHDLTVTFDQAAMDALTHTLGRAPWLGTRPRLVVFLGVDNIKFADGVGTKQAYMLARDGTVDKSVDMRESFTAAAAKAGLPVAFPSQAALAAHGWTEKTLVDAAPADLAAVAREADGDIALAGCMVFSEATLGWVTDWRLAYKGAAHRWGERGVNYDQAFRNAVFGAAQILAGHGEPKGQ